MRVGGGYVQIRQNKENVSLHKLPLPKKIELDFFHFVTGEKKTIKINMALNSFKINFHVKLEPI